MMKSNVVSVVGKSGSGKTTLIEKVVSRLKSLGLKIGVAKHAFKNFEIDNPAKDSYKFYSAGADVSLVASDEKIALTSRVSTPLSLAEMLGKYMGGLDLVITEGFAGEQTPKIEVVRNGHSKDITSREEDILFIVTDDDSLAKKYSGRMNVFGFDEIENISVFIVLYLVMAGKTAFVGVGNPLRGDDGFGPETIERMKKNPRCLYIKGDSSPENYLGKITGFRPEYVVVFDTLISDGPRTPGKMGIYSARRLPDAGFSTHGSGIKMFLEYLNSETAVPVFIIGVEPENLSFSEGLSAPVEAAVVKIEKFSKGEIYA